MSWFFLAIFAYLLLAFESVANKFLITGKVKSWRLYLFYVGILSATSFLFIPFGLQWPGMRVFLITVSAGIIFFGYLAFLFSSLKGSSASRIFVLIGAVSTLATVALSAIFLKEQFNFQKLFGIMLLVAGGVLISFKFYKRKFFSGYKKSLLAGVLLAVSMIVLKYSYGQQNFVSGYVYSRLGIVGMTGLLLLIPSYRKHVFSLMKKKDKKQHATNAGAVIGVKTLSGVATFIREYSISIGSVAIVSALSSVQYLFVFLISLILSFYFKKVIKESTEKWSIFYKTFGVIAVIVGVFMVLV